MILVAIALMLEARPVIARLGLESGGPAPFPVFHNSEHLLIVTGTGPLKAALATGWAFGRYPGIRAALNTGFCGGHPEAFSLHQWYAIHSIRDASSGRLLVPDILWRHPFPEAGLLTTAAPMDTPDETARLVDMEGSGFYEAARRFLPPDRMALLKWVSDPLEGNLDPQTILPAFCDSLDPLNAFLENWPLPADGEALGAVCELEAAIHQRLRLTHAQGQDLRRWVSGYLARGGSPQVLLNRLPDGPPSAKRDNARHLASLKDVFKS
jgi:hypothetical protein